MIKNEDDTFTGIKTTPFNYTGRTVLGRKSYRDEINAELLRVIGMKGRWSKYPNGYKDKYPDSWETEVIKVVDRKNCDVSEIMDYCVSEGKRIYQNTEFVDTFMIFHDGLSQWWEKDAQQYLHEVHNFKIDKFVVTDKQIWLQDMKERLLVIHLKSAELSIVTDLLILKFL